MNSNNPQQPNNVQIKIMKTSPSIHVEKRVSAVIGPHTTSLPNNMDKYCEILCYHPNPWSLNNNTLKNMIVQHMIIDSTNCDEFINTLNTENIVGKVRDVYVKDTSSLTKINDIKQTAGIVNVISLETLQNAMPHYFANTRNRPIDIVPIHEFVYPLAMTFLRTHVFHFDTTNTFTYNIPEQSQIFGNISVYHSYNEKDAPEFNKTFAPIILIQQYYVPDDKMRRKEINYCLKKNVSSGLFDKIVLLNEKMYDKYDCSVIDNDVVEQVIIGSRLTYFKAMDFAKKSLPQYSYVVLANSDIYFNNTLNSMLKLNMEKTFLALLRFDLKGDLFDKDYQDIHIFGPRADSQDTWIWQNTPQFNPKPEADFPLGKKGCDNAITSIFLKQKYRVLNPAFSIQTIHVHMSEMRTYSQKEIIYYPFYTMVNPHNIASFYTTRDIDNYVVHTGNTSSTMSIPYPHYSQEIRTFMHYAEKKHGKAPKFNENMDVSGYHYQKISAFDNVFLNINGLVYDRNNFYKYSKNVKFSEEVSVIQTTKLNKEAINLVVPGEPTLFNFMTKVYPRLIMLSSSSLNKLPFILRVSPELIPYLKPLENKINIIPFVSGTVQFAHRLYCPEIPPELSWPKEFSTIIRRSMTPHKTPEELMNVLIIRDLEFYNEDESWEDFLSFVKEKLGNDYTYTTIENKKENYHSSTKHFTESSIIVGHRCNIMANAIFAPPKSHMIEIAYEGTPDLELWNMCSACDINYTLVAYKREPKERQQFMIKKKLGQALDTNPFPIQKIEVFDFESFKQQRYEESADIMCEIEESPLSFKVNDLRYHSLQHYISYWQDSILNGKDVSVEICDISNLEINNKDASSIFISADLPAQLKLFEESKPLAERNDEFVDMSNTDVISNVSFAQPRTIQQYIHCLASGCISMITEELKQEIMNNNPIFLKLEQNKHYVIIDDDKTPNEIIEILPDVYKRRIHRESLSFWKKNIGPVGVWNKVIRMK